MKSVTVIAIGGGGFTHHQDPALEEFIFRQCRQPLPKIGYIGNANNDMSQRIDRFYNRFSEFEAILSHLPESDFNAHASDWIKQQNLIYVGGGNTASMLNGWHQTGIGDLLINAAENGTIMCGVSAGAVCWYDCALSDSSGTLGPLPALGMIAGSCCPHYSTEPERQASFQEHISKGLIGDGIAIDDGVAVLATGNKPVAAFSARKGAGAYFVKRQNHEISTTAVPVINVDGIPA